VYEAELDHRLLVIRVDG